MAIFNSYMLVYQRVRYWKCLHWSGGSPRTVTSSHVSSLEAPPRKFASANLARWAPLRGAKEIVGIVGMEFHGMKQAIPIKTVVRLDNPVCIYIYIHTYTYNNTSTPPGTLGISHQKFPFSKSLIIDGFDLKEIFNSNRSSECFELSYCRFTFQKPMCISRGHSFSKSHFRAFHSIQHQLTQALHVFRPLAVAKIPWQWCCSSSQRRCSPRYTCDVLSLNIYSWRKYWYSYYLNFYERAMVKLRILMRQLRIWKRLSWTQLARYILGPRVKYCCLMFL